MVVQWRAIYIFIIKKKFCFRVFVAYQKSCKDSSEGSVTPVTPSPQVWTLTLLQCVVTTKKRKGSHYTGLHTSLSHALHLLRSLCDTSLAAQPRTEGTPARRLRPSGQVRPVPFRVALSAKESACQPADIRDSGSIPGLGRSPEEEMATHSSILAWRIPMDRGAWWATVHGVTELDMTQWLTLSTYK